MTRLFNSNTLRFFFLGLALLPSLLFGQDLSQERISDLQRVASERVDAQDLLGARPYLLELIRRFEGGSESEKKSLEAIYFYTGASYMVEYGNASEPSNALLESAISWFQRLNNEFPDGFFIVMSSMAMADAYRGLQNWEEAAKVYEKLLSPPLSLRLSPEERQEALKNITQAYYILQNWEQGEPWFQRLFTEASMDEDKAAAAAALMEAYINQDKFQDVIGLFPFLVGETPARYGLRLNVSFMEAGDKLAENKRYSEAMLMYRMVLTLEEIITWQKERLANLKAQYRLLKLTTGGESERAFELDAEIFNVSEQIRAMEEINSYTPELRVRIARNYLLTGRDWESFWAYNALISDFPNHSNIEDFIYAAFTGASKIGMTDEVVKLGETYLQDPTWTEYRSDILLKIAEAYLSNGRVQDFFDLADRFIKQYPSDKYGSQMVFLMGSTYVQQQDFIGLISRFQDYLKEYPDEPMTDGLIYWIGMAYFFQQDYEEALTRFNQIVDSYKGGPYYEDSLYRKGICLFGLQQTKQARQVFKDFVSQYPNSNLRGEAEYFMGDLEASVPNIDAALEHYANVEKFTTSQGFIENAYFQSGKLLEANERYDDMVSLFQQYINKYREKGDLTEAIYQLGRARELQGSPGLMLNVYWDAIQRFGDNPKAYGMDKIISEYGPRYYDNLKKMDANLAFLEKVSTESDFREAMAEDRMVLFDYISENPAITEDVKRPFYDRAFRKSLTKSVEPIEPMIDKYRTMRAEMPLETPEEQFQIGYEEAKASGERTLALRLQKALADMGVIVNPSQVFTEEDFRYGSPTTLVWMGEQNGEFDPQLARLAYRKVLSDHAESDAVIDALLGLAELEAEAGNYNEAIGLYKQVSERFPADDKVVLAMLGLADTYLASGQGDLARESYQVVLDNRGWRGAPHAEALFKIGKSYYDAEQLELAQTFFERTYIGHSAFTEWAGAAYYYSGRVLERMGKPSDAAATYDEFLETPIYEGTTYFDEIKNARAAL